MAKTKNVYYIATLADGYEDSEFDNKSTLKELVDGGVRFLIDMPDSHGSCSYSDKINKDVMAHKKLSELIGYFLFEVDNDFDDDELAVDCLGAKIEELAEDLLVLRKDTKLDSFSIVHSNEIYNCYNNLIDNMELSQNDISFDNMLSYSSKSDFIINNEVLINGIEKFTNTVEQLIEKDNLHLFISSPSSSYDIIIVKKDSKLHKHYLKNSFLVDVEPTQNEFIYENHYDNLKKFIMYGLTTYGAVGISIRVNISDIDFKSSKNNKDNIQKTYGFTLIIKDGEIEIHSISAKELLECYTTNGVTGELMPPEKNVIYCGADKDDFICGFDLQ